MQKAMSRCFEISRQGLPMEALVVCLFFVCLLDFKHLFGWNGQLYVMYIYSYMSKIHI